MVPDQRLQTDPHTDTGSLHAWQSSLVRLSSVPLHNDFNVLDNEQGCGVIDDSAMVIALGADLIGGDD